MKKFKLTRETKENIYSLFYGLFTVVVLVFDLLAINETLYDSTLDLVYLFITFLFLSLSRGLLSLYAFFVTKENRIAFIKNVAFAGIYLVIAILIISFLNFNTIFYVIICALYMSTIIANRICLVFEKKGNARRIYNSILAALALALTITILVTTTGEAVVRFLVVLLVIILLVTFAQVLGFSFSKIQLRGLLKIIRKTYVFEIIYGLLLLMVSFSFYFMIMEEGFETFGDAMWYSFAIVTTIGLGDFTVTSIISRVLSVILGMYGIVVVASITSVIVNFYNETKGNDKKEEKEIENKDENSTEEKKEDKEN